MAGGQPGRRAGWQGRVCFRYFNFHMLMKHPWGDVEETHK